MTRDGDRAFMRGMLAGSGILLDEPARPRAAAPSPSDPGPVDRAAVRRVLVAAGAPEKDLEWLSASAPSIDYARTYRPPAREAWCLECSSPQPTDAAGCLTCRERTASP